MLTTLRKGLTKLETAGYAAGSLVQHPLDWKDVELARASSNAVEHLSLPYDPATRRLFEVSAMATVGEAAGVGHVPARDAVVVDTDSLSVGCSVVGELQRGRLLEEPNQGPAARGRSGTSVLSLLGVV